MGSALKVAVQSSFSMMDYQALPINNIYQCYLPNIMAICHWQRLLEGASKVRWGSVQVSAQHSHPAGRELRRALRSQSVICRPFIHHTIRSWPTSSSSSTFLKAGCQSEQCRAPLARCFACPPWLSPFSCSFGFSALFHLELVFFIYFKSFIQVNTFDHNLRKKKPHSRT